MGFICKHLGKTSVRAVLAVGFSAVTWIGFCKGWIESETLIDLVKTIVLFYFIGETVNRNERK